MVDLGEVVILSGQPEDGDVRMAGLRGLLCASESSGGLEGGKERSAEESDLLTGDDDTCALTEGIE